MDFRKQPHSASQRGRHSFLSVQLFTLLPAGFFFFDYQSLHADAGGPFIKTFIMSLCT